MRAFWGVLLLSGTAWAGELGAEGESCMARSDCAEGLRCVDQVCSKSCTDTADCPEGTKCSGGRCRSKKKKSDDSGDSSAADLSGVHGYVGATIGGGGGVVVVSGRGFGGGAGYGAFQGQLHGGVLIDRLQIHVDFEPFSTLYFAGGLLAVFHGTVSFGTLLPLGRNVYWPLRVGAGGGVVASGGAGGIFEARADLLGVGFLIDTGGGAVMIDCALPSFRYMTNFSSVHFLTWTADVGISYVF